MKTFKNKYFTKRNYECTNVVFAQSETTPTHDTNGNLITDGRWVECREDENTCNQLFISGGVRYFGYM
jgi:hypothetical protein